MLFGSYWPFENSGMNNYLVNILTIIFLKFEPFYKIFDLKLTYPSSRALIYS